MPSQSTIPLSTLCPYPVTEMELAYTAGLFDGEGSVTITLNRSQKTDVAYHKLQVSLANTNFIILDWLKERYGGAISNMRPATERNRPSARWQLGSRSAATFLATIRPYLIIKAAAADAAIELQMTRMKSHGQQKGMPRGQGTIPLDPGVFGHREELRLRLNVLNKRGADPIE